MKNISAAATILLVEDEAIIAADIAARLVRMGYLIIGTTGNGDEAIALAGEHRPDVVLMDIMLDGPMPGTEAAQRIRETLKIPVIFVTANSDDITLDSAFNASPFGYVLKPFEDRELRIAIEMGLYRHRVETEREKLVEQLRQALEQVKTLSGLLPICVECKSIRDDQGYWSKVERYIMEHSQASFSHGLCPKCAVKALENVGCEVPPELRDAVKNRIKS